MGRVKEFYHDEIIADQACANERDYSAALEHSIAAIVAECDAKGLKLESVESVRWCAKT